MEGTARAVRLGPKIALGAMGTGPSWRRRYAGTAATLAVAAALATSAMSACGSPKYHYVKNSEERTYVRVPNEWALFDEDQLVTTLDESREAKDLYKKLTWSVGFDAAPRPSLDHIASISADHPKGVVLVRSLLPEQRDRFSLSTLRSVLLGFDPLEAQEEGVEVVDSRDVDRPGGLHGNEILVNLTTPEGERVKWHQIALVDSALRKVHLLSISCDDDCYAANEKVIGEVIASWQVKER